MLQTLDGTERYLITRYKTDNPSIFNQIPDELKETISEVHHPEAPLYAQGTFGIDLPDDLAARVATADNLLPVNGLMKLSDYGLGAAIGEDTALPDLAGFVEETPALPSADEQMKSVSLEVGNASAMLKQYVRGPAIDQGREGACVGFSGTNFLRGGPLLSFRDKGVAWLESFAQTLYRECQDNDEWPGRAYSGTSITALVKVLTRRGLIRGGAMTRDLGVQDRFVANVSSLLLASNWYEGMYRTDANGFIRPSGRLVGGHAYWQFGLSKWLTKYIYNSWGRSFGFGGVGYMSRSDSEWLARHGNLRAYAAVQTRR